MDRRYIHNQNGRDHVLYAGLLALCHEQSAGRFSISTTLVQIPNEANGNTAICTAEARIFDANGQVIRSCTGIGDASPANVNRLLAVHVIRFAETRSKARALRDLVNVGEALADDESSSVESWPEQEAAPATPPASNGAIKRALDAAAEQETITVNGKPLRRDGVLALYAQVCGKAERQGIPVTRLADDAPLEDLVNHASEVNRQLKAVLT